MVLSIEATNIGEDASMSPISTAISSSMNERVIEVTHESVKEVKPQAIASLKEELGLSEEIYARLVRLEDELDSAIQGSIFLGTSKSLIDFRIGQYLALMEESLPNDYFDKWIKSKVSEQNWRTWKTRYGHWQQLQFAVALGAAQEGIDPEEYLLQNTGISSQIWYMLGSRRCPEEVSKAAYNLIREGYRLQEYQLIEARRKIIALSSGSEDNATVEISKEEKIQIAEDVIQKSSFSNKKPQPSELVSDDPGLVEPVIEILDTEYSEVDQSKPADPDLSLIEENRRLRELLSSAQQQLEASEQEKAKLLVKISQLQAQIDLYKANSATASQQEKTDSPPVSDRISELAAMPLSEIRKKAETTASIMDLKDIAAAWGITLNEKHKKEIIRDEVMAGLPQVFNEEFSDS